MLAARPDTNPVLLLRFGKSVRIRPRTCRYTCRRRARPVKREAGYSGAPRQGKALCKAENRLWRGKILPHRPACASSRRKNRSRRPDKGLYPRPAAGVPSMRQEKVNRQSVTFQTYRLHRGCCTRAYFHWIFMDATLHLRRQSPVSDVNPAGNLSSRHTFHDLPRCGGRTHQGAGSRHGRLSGQTL